MTAVFMFVVMMANAVPQIEASLWVFNYETFSTREECQRFGEENHIALGMMAVLDYRGEYEKPLPVAWACMTEEEIELELSEGMKI